jgi:hypothetical protein
MPARQTGSEQRVNQDERRAGAETAGSPVGRCVMRGGNADDRQQRCSACKFAPDSPLEVAGFELAVPLAKNGRPDVRGGVRGSRRSILAFVPRNCRNPGR